MINSKWIHTKADEIHANSVRAGWWDPFPRKMDRHETAMMLVVSELAEAMEGDRKSLMDDHLPQHKMFDVEIADAMIRLLDLAGAYKIELDMEDMRKFAFALSNVAAAKTPVEQLWRTVKAISNSKGPIGSVVNGLAWVTAVASANAVDLERIVDEKVAYNKVRADHKLENRAKEGGKAY